jgi:hypothetical protein
VTIDRSVMAGYVSHMAALLEPLAERHCASCARRLRRSRERYDGSRARSPEITRLHTDKKTGSVSKETRFYISSSCVAPRSTCSKREPTNIPIKRKRLKAAINPDFQTALLKC